MIVIYTKKNLFGERSYKKFGTGGFSILDSMARKCLPEQKNKNGRRQKVNFSDRWEKRLHSRPWEGRTPGPLTYTTNKTVQLKLRIFGGCVQRGNITRYNRILVHYKDFKRLLLII